MTRLFNDPEDFADELVAGFVEANRDFVRIVPGGVVRRHAAPTGQVALVTGGGSGHYPAFAGLVGPGLAHGAAMGNVFASPSAQQVYSVARAAESGGGVLLSYGNYAGDVLHFGQAEQRLIADGIDCRTVVVTDDISSASPSERHKRRGIAGDLAIFKVAGAAAEGGYSLDDVERVARLANERTRSIGVAFSGCTLPGAVDPLFTVPEGRMAIGMGIHGEPGIDETDVSTADELAELLVGQLLAERPDGVGAAKGARVGVILNGLGAVKYEELFVVYRHVAAELGRAGLTIVGPEVGELVTSFDMAGVSLTLFWLDDELERLWLAGAASPAFSRGAPPEQVGDALADVESAEDDVEIGPASPTSREVAVRVSSAIEAIAAVIEEHADELGRIDAVAGDGDHGIGMQRGASAATATARAVVGRGAGAGTVLTAAGDAWAYRAGGTSGALWGMALRTLGESFGDETAPDAAALAHAMASAGRSITDFGKAEIGDKTMVDALIPFVDTFSERVASGARATEAWAGAAAAAQSAAEATADLLPLKGRARSHGEKALGTPDAGAISFALIVRAVGDVLSEKQKQE